MAYAEQMLAPTRVPHETLAMDNLPAHKVGRLADRSNLTVCAYAPG